VISLSLTRALRYWLYARTHLGAPLDQAELAVDVLRRPGQALRETKRDRKNAAATAKSRRRPCKALRENRQTVTSANGDDGLDRNWPLERLPSAQEQTRTYKKGSILPPSSFFQDRRQLRRRSARTPWLKASAATRTTHGHTLPRSHAGDTK